MSDPLTEAMALSGGYPATGATRGGTVADKCYALLRTQEGSPCTSEDVAALLPYGHGTVSASLSRIIANPNQWPHIRRELAPRVPGQRKRRMRYWYEEAMPHLFPGTTLDFILPEFLMVTDKGEPHHTIPMILFCPNGHRHIDEGAFERKAHHTHACQECGVVWRPAKVNTHGVQFLPGYKNGTWL